MVKVIAISVFSIFLAGCMTSRIVHNIDRILVNDVGDADISSSDVKRAIVKAAVIKKWRIKDVGPGRMVATVYVRSHSAVVDIEYSDNHYSIHYKNSTNLNYNGRTIHRNYNKWVVFLDRVIEEELANSKL